MGVDLKYDTDDFDTAMRTILNLKQDLETKKKGMLDALTQLRNDWVSDGGDTFFNSIDTDWSDSVDECIELLQDIYDSLHSGSVIYDDISLQAQNYLKFED